MSNATNQKLSAPSAPAAGCPSYPSLYRAYLLTYQAYLTCASPNTDPTVSERPDPSPKKPLVKKTERHGNEEQSEFSCNVCTRSFISRNGLFAHLQEKKHFKKKTRVSKVVLNQPRTVIYESTESPEGKESAMRPQMVEVTKDAKLVFGNPGPDGLFDDLSFVFEDLSLGMPPVFQDKDLYFERDQLEAEHQDSLIILNQGTSSSTKFRNSPKNPTSQEEEVPSSPFSEHGPVRQNRSLSVVTSTAPLDLELFDSESDKEERELIYTKTEPFVPDFSPLDLSGFTLSNRIRAVDLSTLPILQ